MNWQRTQLEVLERDGFRCNRCGSREGLSVYVLSSMRGRHDLAGAADCMTVCESCHPEADAALAGAPGPTEALPAFDVPLPGGRNVVKPAVEPAPEVETVSGLAHLSR